VDRVSAGGVRTVRDPLWGNITLDATAASIVDAPEFQRLRRVKQLGFAHLVYPGAVHTRFLHALGVYHLTGRAVDTLEGKGALAGLSADERAELPIVRLAALLHDVGHYAFSHAMEELEAEAIPGHHEEAAARFLEAPEIRAALGSSGEDAAALVARLIRGTADHPLQGLVSGSLDLDKIDYLRRDSLFCGVPYGAVDVERLLESLTLARESEGAALEVAVTEKGLSALESLLFAKYQMFRNVYWHHACRSATALYKRIVEESVRIGLLDPEELVGPTDEELLYEVSRRAMSEESDEAERLVSRWIPALRNRRLPKRALELTAADLGDRTLPAWAVGDTREKRTVEDRLADRLDLAPGEVVIDFPARRSLFELNLLVRRRDGRVERLGEQGLPGMLDLPRVGQALSQTAKVLRVFTFERREVDPDDLLAEVLQA
jgi:HD superfamily phosphohydrolase